MFEDVQMSPNSNARNFICLALAVSSHSFAQEGSWAQLGQDEVPWVPQSRLHKPRAILRAAKLAFRNDSRCQPRSYDASYPLTRAGPTPSAPDLLPPLP